MLCYVKIVIYRTKRQTRAKPRKIQRGLLHIFVKCGDPSSMRRIVSFLKEYISIIAIVPLLLGGLWQVLSLGLISPSYLRFFSVTQQIADGIVVLFVLSILAVATFFVGLLFALQRSTVDWWMERSKSHLMYSLVTHSLVIIYAAVTGYALFFPISFPTIGADLTGLQLIVFAIVLIGFLGRGGQLIYHIAIALLRKNGFKLVPINSVTRYIAFPLALIVVLLVVALSLGLLQSLVSFHSQYMFPSNLKNIDYALDKYCEETGSANRDSLKIIYMNDKYVFIRDKQTVSVEKLDYIFKNK